MKKTLTLLTLLLIICTNLFATYYYQGKLSDKENSLYINIATNLLQEENTVEVSPSFTKEQIKKVNEAIFKDLPQLFFVEPSYNYKWKEKPDGTVISSTLVYTFKNYEEGVHATRAIVHNKILEFLKTLDKLESDSQKITVMYKFFALARDYDISLQDDQSCYSVLIKKRGVCASYARTFQYIMISSGIECIYVTGELNGVSHAWNMVNLDDNWYNVDVTNGNTGFDDYVTYQYLLIPTSTLMKTVQIDDINNIPLAVKDNYNYYKNNDLYISSFSEKSISARVSKAIKDNEKGITFEAKNQSILDKIENYLITEQEIYKLISKDSITYTISQERLLITIHF